MDIIVNGGLTKKQYGVLRAADRSCGLSYKSACKRGIDMVRELQDFGLIKIFDTKRNLGQFKFYTTEQGKNLLNENND